MIPLRITFDRARLALLHRRLATITNQPKRRRGLEQMARAGAKIYRQSAKPAAPVRTGALRKSLKIHKVPRPKNADVNVKIKPDPTHYRHARPTGQKGAKLLSIKESQALLQSEIGKTKAQRTKRIRPSKYAHLTEIRNTTSRDWMRRDARRRESTALRTCIATLQTYLKATL